MALIKKERKNKNDRVVSPEHVSIHHKDICTIKMLNFRPLPEEDVDGREMSEEEGLIEDSVSPSRDSRHDRTPRSGEMSEERRQKLREIEVGPRLRVRLSKGHP